MTSLQKYTSLKNKVDSLKEQADKAQGAYEQVLIQLEEELGTKNIKQARIVLSEIKQEHQELEDEFISALKEWKEKCEKAKSKKSESSWIKKSRRGTKQKVLSK